MTRKEFFEWSDQLIGWSGDQADQQLIWSADNFFLTRQTFFEWSDQLIWSADWLIRLISSWSDQLIKKILFFYPKKNLEKKNIFWMIWSTDLISWSGWSDQLTKFLKKNLIFLKRIFFECSDQLIWLVDWLIRLIWSTDKKISTFF